MNRNCLYVLTECTNGCGFILQRKELPGHLEHLCYFRQVQCEHCGLEGAYQFVVDEHYDLCPKVPVSCPNTCGGNSIPREGLDEHRKVCPLDPVQCTFQVVGCKAVVARKHLHDHLETLQANHLEMALSVVTSMHQRVEFYHSEVVVLKEELERSKDAQEALKELLSRHSFPSPRPRQVAEVRNAQLSPMLQHLEAEASDCLSDPFLPVVIKMENFSELRVRREPWYSAAFYTSTFGYKMSLCVYASGICSGQGTHLSVYVHLMAGEFDDRLTWPIREALTVELQNQLSDTRHFSIDCNFTQNSPHTVTRRVTSPTASIARKGSGSPTFILLSELGLRQCGTPQRPRDCQYLKGDCLYFSVY